MPAALTPVTLRLAGVMVPMLALAAALALPSP